MRTAITAFLALTFGAISAFAEDEVKQIGSLKLIVKPAEPATTISVNGKISVSVEGALSPYETSHIQSARLVLFESAASNIPSTIVNNYGLDIKNHLIGAQQDGKREPVILPLTGRTLWNHISAEVLDVNIPAGKYRLQGDIDFEDTEKNVKNTYKIYSDEFVVNSISEVFDSFKVDYNAADGNAVLSWTAINVFGALTTGVYGVLYENAQIQGRMLNQPKFINAQEYLSQKTEPFNIADPKTIEPGKARLVILMSYRNPANVNEGNTAQIWVLTDEFTLPGDSQNKFPKCPSKNGAASSKSYKAYILALAVASASFIFC